MYKGKKCKQNGCLKDAEGKIVITSPKQNAEIFQCSEHINNIIESINKF